MPGVSAPCSARARGLAAAAPAQAGRIGDARAQAERAWARIQSDGQRLERVVERSNRARLRLAQTDDSIHQNQVVLAATRVNLRHAEQALSASLISAYKSPVPDPLEAALEARNFGQVLEQFALLDRTNTYNAEHAARRSAPTASRSCAASSVLARERARAAARPPPNCESLQPRIRSSVAAEKRRYRGLRAEVRRLIEQRRRAEVAASRRAAAQDAGAARGRGRRRRQRHRRREHGDATSGAAARAVLGRRRGAVGVALSQLGTPVRPGRRRARAASTARASSPGPTRRPATGAAALHRRALERPARASTPRASSRRATSSSSTASTTSACTSAAASSSRRRTPATSSRSRTSPSRSDYIGAVRISG